MQLHKAPLALLGAFALKVLGRNPHQFGETVLPTVDVYDQYLALEATEVRVQNTIAIGARTSVASHIVPQGRAYRILAIGNTIALDAADVAITGTVFTSITSPAVSGCVIEPQGALVVGGAIGTFRTLGHLLPRPLFLPPGFQINARVYLSANVTVAAPYNSTLFAQVIEL